MSNTIISCWYNEEILAPFFIKHYSHPDNHIIILLDQKTNDHTEEIIRYHNIEIIPVKYPDNKFDEFVKRDYIKEQYEKAKTDWVTIVDADEFVFDMNFNFFEDDIYYVKLMEVYRHVSEKDLDINLSIRGQRRHGHLVWIFEKPCILRSKLDIIFGIGNHSLLSKDGENRLTPYPHSDVWFMDDMRWTEKNIASNRGLIGAHWRYADPFIIKNRLLKNRANINGGNTSDLGPCPLGSINWQYNQYHLENILSECESHGNDPEVF